MPSRKSLEKVSRALGVTAEEIGVVAKARISPKEMRIFQILTELEALFDQPGVKGAINALRRPLRCARFLQVRVPPGPSPKPEQPSVPQ